MKIYMIRNKKTGKEFIGSEIKDLSRDEIFKKLKKIPYSKELQKDLKNESERNFEYKLLKRCKSIEDLETSETQLKEAYGTMGGYNEHLGTKILCTTQKSTSS